MGMKEKRIELHNILVGLCDHVYYQAPSNMKREYPAIMYKRKTLPSIDANNNKYAVFNEYELTVVDYVPDSELVESVSLLPRCRHDRHYTDNNLNYDIFTIIYK